MPATGPTRVFQGERGRPTPCQIQHVFANRFVHLIAVSLLGFVALASVGCGVGNRYPVSTASEITFTPDLNTEYFANTGDDLFVKGTAVQTTALRMSNSFSGSIPGAYGLPFDLTIAQCDLVHQFSTAAHDYYVADYDNIGANHSMLGSVIRAGDMAGVRVSKSTGEMQWFVDNSRYNRQETVWAGKVRPEHEVEFEEIQTLILNDQSQLKTLRFSGFRANQVHFELIDRQGPSNSEDDFSFDLETDGTTTIGVRGYVLEVLSVDNIGLRYRWLSFPSQP
jgi:hypothetical protein